MTGEPPSDRFADHRVFLLERGYKYPPDLSKEDCVEALKQNGTIPCCLIQSEDICLKAVKQNGTAIRKLKDEEYYVE
ncbi:MAG: DUF4116 domain-containing protein [Candidatus Heimdallarchaeaceae archaeon]